MTAQDGIFGCRGIGISFGGRAILRDVTLSVSPGEVLGLVGPNGAGKTSLFEILCGRYIASAGQVMMEGRDVTTMAVHDRARAGLARTYQSPVVPGALTIGESLRAVNLLHLCRITILGGEDENWVVIKFVGDGHFLDVLTQQLLEPLSQWLVHFLKLLQLLLGELVGTIEDAVKKGHRLAAEAA